MKPRSPVSSTMRAVARRRARRARRTNALLIGPRSELGERLRVLVVGHRPVVPLDLALHERDALAEGRAARRATCGGPSAGSSPSMRRGERRRRRARRPRATSQPKARQRSASGARSSTSARVAERLLAVQVDDRDRGSPSRWCAANIAASQTEPSLHSASLTQRRRRAAPSPAGAPRARRRPPIEQALAERAGREVDAASRVLGMHAEQAAVAAVGVERRLRRGQPRQAQRRVERERRVALREDEAVAVGVVGAGSAQHVPVERGEDVGDRQRRADVADVARASTAR